MEWHQKLRIKEFQTAALKKLKYAFLWSEIVQLPYLSDPLANLIGGGLLPDVNLAANMFNSQYEYPGGYLQYHEKSFQVCTMQTLRIKRINLENSQYKQLKNVKSNN